MIDECLLDMQSSE